VVKKAEIKKILRPLNEYMKANGPDNYYDKVRSMKLATLESHRNQKPMKTKKVTIKDHPNSPQLCSSRQLNRNENEDENIRLHNHQGPGKQTEVMPTSPHIPERPLDFSMVADPRLSRVFSQLTMKGNEATNVRRIAEIIGKVNTESFVKEQTDQRADVIKEELRERRKYLITKLLGYSF
jgi:hypothetical protein